MIKRRRETMLTRENEAKKRSSQGGLEYAHKNKAGKRNRIRGELEGKTKQKTPMK